MNSSDYLRYSAKEPMTLLRKKFNNGEKIYKDTPKVISGKEALEDVLYTQYVFENAYSGYSYYGKPLFDHAFDQIIESIHCLTEISPNQLIDIVCSHLAFINDGHLAFTTSEYGKGFYQKLKTYVSNMSVRKDGDTYYDLDSGKQVRFDETVRTFPTIGKDGISTYLIGVRSKAPPDDITVQLGETAAILPLHKIMSEEMTGESLLEERYEDNVAIITSSSFVGDSDKAMSKLYEVGKKCKKYQHVVWNLSNNLGGNSEFPKHFLSGLFGELTDSVKILDLQSTLVCAKETGEINYVPYHLSKAPQKSTTEREQSELFSGQLHVIINDRVASSAELAIAWSASYPNVTFYGCNSLGIGRFGDLCIYYLPNSQIVLWCPQKVFDANIQETVGFEPTYWIDSRHVVSEVLTGILRV